nr:LLM class flavin-dependent oxidoreductase [Angustibacter aerolatus]
MSRQRKQIHLAAHFPGVNNTTVWSDPAAGSHIEFESFRRFAQTAERGRFDFLFLAEGLRLREQHGRIHDLDVVGRPDTFTVLAALAAVTERIGLTGTINSTFNEPYEVARQFASLDHLSGGRAAWNVVTSLGRVHRRELPPRRVPRAGRPVRAGPHVPADRDRAVGLVAGRRGARRPRLRAVPQRPARRLVQPPRPVLRRRGPLRRAAQPAGTTGDLPGRRLRRGTRLRGVVRRRDLLPAHRTRCGEGLLRRRQGSARAVRSHP